MVVGGDHYFRFNHPTEVAKKGIKKSTSNTSMKDFEFARNELIEAQRSKYAISGMTVLGVLLFVLCLIHCVHVCVCVCVCLYGILILSMVCMCLQTGSRGGASTAEGEGEDDG